MSRFLSGDSTVPTVEYHALLVFLGPFGLQGISPTRIQERDLGVRQISFRILPIVRYSSQAYSLPEKLIKWVLSDAQLTGTITSPAAS